MRNVFDDFAVNVLCEFHRSFCPAGGAHPSALAGEGYDEERVFAPVAVYPCGSMSKDAAVQVLIKGLHYLVT
jgi:hypothetical protein